MANVETRDVALDVAQRLEIVAGLLGDNPTCAVAVYDRARNMRDAESTLAAVGIMLDGHTRLATGTLAQFLAVSDVWMVSDAALAATLHGSSTRTVRMRDGQTADMHLIDIGADELTTVAIFVAGRGQTIVGTPPPTAIAASPRVGVVVCDAFAVIVSATPSASVLLGQTTTIEGTPIVNLIYPDDREMAIVNWAAAKDQRGVALRWRLRLLRSDGSPVWIEATITNDIGVDGETEVRLDLCDISREVAATESLVAERELIELLTETLPVGVAKFDATGRVEHANGRLTDLLAPLDPHEVLGRAVRGDLDEPDLAAAFAELLADGVAARLVVDHTGADDVVKCLEWTIRAALGKHGEVTGGVVCIADVTEATRLRQAIELRATTDALTGCLNRAGTMAALEQALADVGPTRGVGLLFIDLDGFKGINDSLGHALGDTVLEVVASRLRGALRSGDLVGRFGGDEFVVVSPGLPSASAAMSYADRISQRVHGPAVIDEITVQIAASIGVAWSTNPTATELLAAADAAMYVAKQTRSTTPVLSPAPPEERVFSSPIGCGPTGAG
jgi:diguanylate cyclase (GGDEF)-like protein